jgi:hypothetical protein
MLRINQPYTGHVLLMTMHSDTEMSPRFWVGIYAFADAFSYNVHVAKVESKLLRPISHIQKFPWTLTDDITFKTKRVPCRH